MKRLGLTGNQLKIIAMVTMTLDHIGLILFPYSLLLRIIGRLAFPIYAYMIAEGCRHTRSMGRYLLTIAGIGIFYQIVCLLNLHSLYQSILITFSLSIGLIWLSKTARKKKSSALWTLTGLSVVAIFIFTEVLPLVLPRSWDFGVDYGFIGVMIPVGVYYAKKPFWKLLVCGIGLAMLAATIYWIQWFALAALPLLALYNGRRGKGQLKWLFYLYYPAHLILLYAIASVL